MQRQCVFGHLASLPLCEVPELEGTDWRQIPYMSNRSVDVDPAIRLCFLLPKCTHL
ncbi:hypothetical protein Mapa_003665 [Marchantia paleacea]|nr:hypothetical protein Mapa_003665 [Marchantia paleacea]